MALLKDITYDDRLGMDEAEGYDEADGEDDNQVEEREEVDVTGEVNDATNPRQQAVNNDIYDPEKTPYQREPLANKFQITFKITSQAVVNVLYDMDPWDLRKAVCGAIKNKRHPTRDFSGTSYLSDVSLLNSGDISAFTFNEKQEDISLSLQMSDWDRDIVDHEVGINFGTHWCYPIHMKGVKESSLSGELSSRRQKAALIRELVCINTTTLTSLRIHHIKDVHYLRDFEEGSEVLAIEFFEFEQAHAALSRGLSYNGKHFVCDTLEKINFLARCGDCQAYGHGSGACSDPPRCGKCTERHRTKFCRSLLEKCALCDGRHASNSPKCQVKQAERNSVGFVPVSSRRPEATINAETAVSIQRSSHNHNAAKSDVEPNCCQHADALKQVEESLKEMREVLRGSISADARNTIEGRSQKRAALEPLINGASNNPGRPAKRVKQEEQQKTETMDLYRIPSPYVVHRN